MNKLLNTLREGGYPLVGENLKILSEDYPAYLNSILAGLQLPANTCVFLSLNQQNGKLADSIVYVNTGIARWNGIYNMKGNPAVNISDLLSGNHSFSINIPFQNFPVINNSGSFPDVYQINYAELQTAESGIFKFLMLDDAIKSRVLQEVYYDTSEVKVEVYSRVVFDEDGNIDPQYLSTTLALNPDFNNTLKIVNNEQCFVQLSFEGSSIGGTNIGFVITLPEAFRLAKGALPVIQTIGDWGPNQHFGQGVLKHKYIIFYADTIVSPHYLTLNYLK